MQSTLMLKLIFTQSLAILDVTKTGLERVILIPKEVTGILDLRSMGYYKIRQGILQYKFSKYYRFESADTMCEQFNKFLNMVRKEKRKKCKKNIHA